MLIPLLSFAYCTLLLHAGHSPSMRGTANGTGVNSPSYPGPSGSTRGNGQGSSINGKDNSGECGIV
jgi:hypothetical protein